MPTNVYETRPGATWARLPASVRRRYQFEATFPDPTPWLLTDRPPSLDDWWEKWHEIMHGKMLGAAQADISFEQLCKGFVEKTKEYRVRAGLPPGDGKWPA